MVNDDPCFGLVTLICENEAMADQRREHRPMLYPSRLVQEIAQDGSQHVPLSMLLHCQIMMQDHIVPGEFLEHLDVVFQLWGNPQPSTTIRAADLHLFQEPRN